MVCVGVWVHVLGGIYKHEDGQCRVEEMVKRMLVYTVKDISVWIEGYPVVVYMWGSVECTEGAVCVHLVINRPRHYLVFPWNGISGSTKNVIPSSSVCL